ncbi:hypothetical protein GCM10020331_000770 [Ectobacillus funiculus]
MIAGLIFLTQDNAKDRLAFLNNTLYSRIENFKKIFYMNYYDHSKLFFSKQKKAVCFFGFLCQKKLPLYSKNEDIPRYTDKQ